MGVVFFSGDRLADFYVGVSDDSPTAVTPSPSPRTYAVCHHYIETVLQGARVRIVCGSPLVGRYVIIQLTGTNYLTMCEVEVYSGELEKLERFEQQCHACIF